MQNHPEFRENSIRQRHDQRAESSIPQDALTETDHKVIMGILLNRQTATDPLDVLRTGLRLSQAVTTAPTVLYVAYMLLVSPATRCRSLLFIILCLKTLRRLLPATSEPSVGPEPMVNRNPSIPVDSTCPVPLNALVFEQRVLATLFYLSLTLWLLRVFVDLEKSRRRVADLRRGF